MRVCMCVGRVGMEKTVVVKVREGVVVVACVARCVYLWVCVCVCVKMLGESLAVCVCGFVKLLPRLAFGKALAISMLHGTMRFPGRAMWRLLPERPAVFPWLIECSPTDTPSGAPSAGCIRLATRRRNGVG